MYFLTHISSTVCLKIDRKLNGGWGNGTYFTERVCEMTIGDMSVKMKMSILMGISMSHFCSLKLLNPTHPKKE